MTEPDEPVLYAEQGTSWWPVLWGPVFVVVGAGVEATTGPVHVAAWIAVAIVLAGIGAVWVSARRRVYRVELTPKTLTQGQERLAVERIAAVEEHDEAVGAPVGAKPLGGGWTVPRKTTEVPLRLSDDTVVLGWARDAEALTAVLRRLLEPVPTDPPTDV
jgi:hypothetical protein